MQDNPAEEELYSTPLPQPAMRYGLVIAALLGCLAALWLWPRNEYRYELSSLYSGQSIDTVRDLNPNSRTYGNIFYKIHAKTDRGIFCVITHKGRNKKFSDLLTLGSANSKAHLNGGWQLDATVALSFGFILAAYIMCRRIGRGHYRLNHPQPPPPWPKNLSFPDDI